MRLTKRLDVIWLSSSPGSVCRGRCYLGLDWCVTGAVVVVQTAEGAK